MPDHQKTSRYTSFFVFLIAIGSISNIFLRYQTMGLLMAYTSAFFCYVWIVRMENNHHLLFGIGVIARLILFFHLPSLSDDIYRFLWDGQLTSTGLNPYHYIPNELVGNAGIDDHLFSLLNSQDYYTIYPPLNQGLFWVTSLAGQGHYLLSTNFIRLILLFGEMGSYFLLTRLSLDNKKIAHWYFLNPLVILEIVGNIHFEGLVIFFLLLALYALQKKQIALSGVGFGLAAATKLIPFIVLPYLFFRYQWKKGLILISLSVLVFVFTFLFLQVKDIQAMLESAQLYFTKFEFNASIYYLLRALGYWWKGYNIIHTLGPWLSVTTFACILCISILGAWRKWKIPATLLFIFSIYLLFSTTIHPWYVLTLLPLGLLAGYYYPLVWTFLVFMTYAGYQKTGYSLSIYWVIIEYVIIFALSLVEIKRKNLVNEYE